MTHRLLLVPMLLLSASAVAETKTWTGEGFKLEASSPAPPAIEFRGPKGSRVRFQPKKYSGENYVLLDSCDLPCKKVPKGDDWTHLVWWVVLSDGGTWAKGELQPQHRTAYLFTIDDPGAQPASVASANEAAPAAVPAAPVGSPGPAPRAPVGMDAAAFNRLRAAIQKEHLPTSKMSVLKLGVRDAQLSVKQVGTLVDLFTHSSDKVEVVRQTRAGLADAENGYELLGHFVHAGDKQRVRAMLEGEDAEERSSMGAPGMTGHLPEMPAMPEMPRMPGM